MPADDPDILKDWPAAKTFGPSVEHLHALGAVSLLFNRLEHSLSYLFGDLANIDRELAEAIYLRLNNSSRLEILRQLAVKACEEPLREHVEHALTCFDICAENRNNLSHIIHHQLPDHPLYLAGRKKNSAKTRDLMLLVDLTELRSVADGIKATFDYVSALSLYQFREWWGKTYPGQPLNALAKLADTGANTLPDKPPRPHKLHLFSLE